jgi:hypothetical protein
METKTKSKPKPEPEPEPEPEPSIKRDEIEAFYGRCAPGTSAFKLPIQLEEGQALYGAAHPSLGQPPPVHVALTSQVREDQAEGRGRAGGQVRRGQPARDGPQEVPRKGGRVGVPGPRTAPPLCARCGRRRREPQGVIHTACCAACCAAQVRLGFPEAEPKPMVLRDLGSSVFMVRSAQSLLSFSSEKVQFRLWDQLGRAACVCLGF